MQHHQTVGAEHFVEQHPFPVAKGANHKVEQEQHIHNLQVAFIASGFAKLQKQQEKQDKEQEQQKQDQKENQESDEKNQEQSGIDP